MLSLFLQAYLENNILKIPNNVVLLEDKVSILILLFLNLFQMSFKKPDKFETSHNSIGVARGRNKAFDQQPYLAKQGHIL